MKSIKTVLRPNSAIDVLHAFIDSEQAFVMTAGHSPTDQTVRLIVEQDGESTWFIVQLHRDGTWQLEHEVDIE